MDIVDTPITGQESLIDQTTPLNALVNFYAAFNSRNIELMEDNWLQTDESSMSNPLGGIKREWRNIRDVYKKIFNGNARVYVEFYDYSIHTTADMFIAVGHERGLLEIGDSKIKLGIRTSRIFKLHNKKWKQIHHHGSMDKPALLNTYQSTLLNQ